MSFGDYGDMLDNAETFINFETAILRFTKRLGLTKNTLLNSVERLLTVTDDYDKKINALKRLPAENRNNLIQVHQQIRRKFTAL